MNLSETLVQVDVSSLIRGESALGIRTFNAVVSQVASRVHELGEGLIEPVGAVIDSLETIQKIALALQNTVSRLVVLGEPAAIAAARVLVPESLYVTWIEHPQQVSSLEGAGIVLLEGPSWADRLVEQATAAGSWVVIAGVGEEDPPPQGWWLRDFDPLGPLSVGALVAAAFAGDPEAVCAEVAQALQVTRVSCLKTALYENPAACLGVAMMPQHGTRVLRGAVQLALDPMLLPLVGWVNQHVRATLQWRGSAGMPEGRWDGLAGLVGDSNLMAELLEAPGYRVFVGFEGRKDSTGHADAMVRATRDLAKAGEASWIGVRLGRHATTPAAWVGSIAAATMVVRAGARLAAALGGWQPEKSSQEARLGWARLDWRKKLSGNQDE